MGQHQTHVRIGGEPFLSRARAYRDQWHDSMMAWSVPSEEKGAVSIPITLTGLNFGRNRQPDGWTKPSGQNGYSSPKKGHPDIQMLADLRRRAPMPDPRAIFGDALFESVAYEGPDCHGVSSIGRMFGPRIGWAGDTMLAVIPDAEAAVAGHLAAYPDHTITNGADAWRLPDGLTRLTEAEYDLIMAQHRVEEERKAAPSAPSAEGGR